LVAVARGRRPGPGTTRAAILSAARRRFAADGFEATSVRAIAAEAGVDPSLPLHFFGSKEDLFREAVGLPFDPTTLVRQLATVDAERLGERLTAAFLAAWEDPDTGERLRALLRRALTDRDSAALLRRFADARLPTELGEPLQVELALAQLLGVALLRHLLRWEPLASTRADELVARLGQVVDGHLAARRPPTSRPPS
jgi:AcrR family transcriptional regulator